MASTFPTTKSGKLEARIAEIQSFRWSKVEKEQAIMLAIATYETNDSITAGGRYKTPGLSDGDENQPRHPGGQATVNERAIREDMTDHS